MVIFDVRDDRLVMRYNGEQLWIEPWGMDSLRVRGTKEPSMPEEDWALSIPQTAKGRVNVSGEEATVTCGRLTAHVTKFGRIRFTDDVTGRELLREYWRARVDDPDIRNQGHGGTDYLVPETGSATNREGREYRPILMGGHSLTVRFESDPQEKLFGMGQYQQPYLDVKNTVLDLSQRNSQASVPFLLSSLGYGFLWNVPATGRAELCKNITVWSADCADKLDYWITAGDTPAAIEESYASVTGTVPMMPDWAMGFWQCKLRYQTQEELLSVAREYRRRGLPIDVIVIDFFHWPLQGEWRFDPTYWPDPDAMIAELKEMGIELMVSVWPTVDYRSENYKEMKARGFLLSSDRGFPVHLNFMGNTVFYDPFSQEAREYVWEKCRQGYYDRGIRTFWLDVAEPEFSMYDLDIMRTSRGPMTAVGNAYPLYYARTFADGMRAAGQEAPLNLLRCAWAGSQRFGALVWSGDIFSTFDSMRCQITAGLSMGLAGIPWWTTDIGGFFGGDGRDPLFRELLVRWFQWACFLPVMRLHGNRLPAMPQVGTTGGAACVSGSPNEVWSFGEEVYAILCRYLRLRERLRPYIRTLMAEAHEKGTPVMRTLFYAFPDDMHAWEVEDTYLFGPSILVAPVCEAGAAQRTVYLPEGALWTNAWNGETFEGGRTVTVPAPLDVIPLFLRDGFRLDMTGLDD